MVNKILQALKDPRYTFQYLIHRGNFRDMSDEKYLKMMFKHRLGYELDLNNPKTFNEKLQWLKLHDRNPFYTQLVDKYEVRRYIAKTIGEEYLIPLIGVWNNFDEIDFSKLPNQFVLKCTHDSGSVFICTDKNEFNIEKARKKINNALKRNYYYHDREWPYKNVKPRIICEKFISDNNSVPADYKVLCFNGKAKLIEMHIDRFGDHKQDFYDEKWNKTQISQEGTRSDYISEKPRDFENMIKLSEKLANNINHVRIDWFVTNNKLYFGEITFFDGSGFYPFDNKEDDYLIGSWISLP
ncbi:glycosyl transferase [Clostridium perfringens]|uniref:ATP-grasp fold amidoligase family protein n=1 Tax=Clostridium perfringens TaxID=1502 RepID=UPI0022473524|nr:ATP-grasp fold amidoligase family protein [Clostridium perfringens]MCX0371595.1 glycosyl transferase [Clostridium perfringens]